MKTFGAVALSTFLLFTSTGAYARGDESSSPPPALPGPAAGPPCRLAEHAGVDDGDAATAAQLVCSELSRAGAPVGARYRVGVGRLGSIIILSAALEGDTFGSTADTREVRLHSIEEVAGAAPRLAGALVHGTVIEDTDSESSPTAPPAPPGALDLPPTPPPGVGRVHFALGLVAQFPPLDRSATPAPGVDFELHADMGSYQILGDFRFGGDSDDNSVGLLFVSFAMGARYFFSEADVSPFVGGGFAWTYESVTDNVHNDFDGNHTGLGAYGELGLEFAHTHKTRLAFAVRLDAPFYSLTNSETFNDNIVPDGTQTVQPEHIATMYYAPLSIQIRLTF
jgi:hypothetical protein